MYEIRSRVGMSHTAKNGNIKLSSILDTLQDCYCFDVDQEKAFSRYIHENHCAVFVAFQQIDILRLPRYGENIITRSWTYQMERFRGTRNTVIYDSDETPLVISYGIGVFVNLKTGLPAKSIPREVLASVKTDPPLEMERLPRRIALPQTHGEVLPPCAAKRYQVDINGHINNARYLDMAVEYLPRDFTVRRMAFQYKNAAKYGDTLYPKAYREVEGKEFYLALNNNSDEADVLIAFYK